MQLEQALDENDLVYHDTMIAANSWRCKNDCPQFDPSQLGPISIAMTQTNLSAEWLLRSRIMRN